MNDLKIAQMLNDRESPIWKKQKVIFAGAMGSGKSEIAINFGYLWHDMTGIRPGLIDLDMVKPYFKLRSAVDLIDSSKVELVIPTGKYRNADFPIIPAVMESYVTDPRRPAVIDVGGDEVGARLLGRYHDKLEAEDIEFWYVYNGMRPLSRGESDVLEIMNGVERGSKLRLSGLVHNSHLMWETDLDIVERNIERAQYFADVKGIPVVFHCVREDLFEEASKRFVGLSLVSLKLHLSFRG